MLIGHALRCSDCGQYKPDRCICGESNILDDLIIGDKYNWKNQPERLIYLGVGIGASYGWYQFAKVEEPDVVWCEVLKSDMRMLERTDN